MKTSSVVGVILGVLVSVPLYADYGESPKCRQIQAKISKSRQLAEFAKHNMRPDQAANAMVNSNRKIARYQQEYHDLGCDGSMPRADQVPVYSRQQPAPMPGNNNPVMSQPPDSKAVCMAQCKQYTSRTDEECFDSCWK